jgi:class 3 adenylate cyclase
VITTPTKVFVYLDMRGVSMENEVAPDAWLESTSDQQWVVGAHSTIGRSPANGIVIDDKLVSRRHALIHRQDVDEFWLVDLGSGNGSLVNGRRVTLPTRVSENDVLMFGETRLKFRQPATHAATPVMHSATLIDVKNVSCWLLLTDIVGSTKLAAKLPSNEWATLVGSWAGECQRIIELHGGVISKYLGDGFLAIWPTKEHPVERVAGGIRKLQELQGAAPSFRIVVHRGEVFSGGSRALGEDPLSGLELIMLFRMERLASSLGMGLFVSEPASSELAAHVKLRSAGQHELPGFADADLRSFYTAG